MKPILLFLFAFCFCIMNAQIVNIPDANFKSFLVNNASINTNNDGEIQMSEAFSVETLYISGIGASTIAGIESFVNLKYLHCYNNPLLKLNLDNNILLENLVCGKSSLDSIVLDSNINLKEVRIQKNYSLSYLSIKNGQNQNLISFSSWNNDKLMCIEIDSFAYSTMSNDYWTEFNMDCSNSYCNSYSFHQLSLFCLYGIDTSTLVFEYDTLNNSLGCDSFLILHYGNFTLDASTAYDSIFILDTTGYLKPWMLFRIISYTGSFSSYIIYFQKSLYDFQWFLDDSLIVGATDSVYLPTSPGIYKVELNQKSDNGLCKVFSDPFPIYPITTISNIATNSFKIYPNPLQDHLEITTDLKEDYEIVIHNILGKGIIRIKGKGNQKMDLKDLENGVYFFQVLDYKSKQILHQEKLIKN